MHFCLQVMPFTFLGSLDIKATVSEIVRMSPHIPGKLEREETVSFRVSCISKLLYQKHAEILMGKQNHH